jgi:non-homologous end joining protein Ku
VAARSIASLSISFGPVSIPVKLYSATESSTAVHFKVMGSGGTRVRQQYVAEPEPAEEPPPPSRAHPGRSMPATKKAPEPIAAKAQPPSPSPRLDVPPPAVIERSEMVKGYEFEKG